MFRNYLKIALRNLKRHKGYSFLNIAGLAVGMACSHPDPPLGPGRDELRPLPRQRRRHLPRPPGSQVLRPRNDLGHHPGTARAGPGEGLSRDRPGGQVQGPALPGPPGRRLGPRDGSRWPTPRSSKCSRSRSPPATRPRPWPTPTPSSSPKERPRNTSRTATSWAKPSASTTNSISASPA